MDVWFLLADQCLLVCLLSGAFITRPSSSSLESVENTNIYSGPYMPDLSYGLRFDTELLLVVFCVCVLIAHRDIRDSTCPLCG